MVERFGDAVTVTYRAHTGRVRRAVFNLDGEALRARTAWCDHPLARRAALAYLRDRGVTAW